MRPIGDVARRIVPQEEEPRPEGRSPANGNAPTPEPPIPPSARAANRGYLARELVQCTMPHSDPKKDVYIRTDGAYRVMIESGTDIRTGEKIGLPHGSKPRLLMLYVNTEAVRIQGEDDPLLIEFGASMNDFLRRVGLSPATGGGKRGDAALVREQHRRLFNAHFSFTRLDGDDAFGGESRTNLPIARQIHTFWDHRRPDQGSLWETYIRLDADFQRLLVANPVPFDFEHLKALKRSALAIDLYCWLTYRLYRANNVGFTVPYQGLFDQFGTGYNKPALGPDGKPRRDRQDNFRAALREALALVAEVYSEIRYEFTPQGLAVGAVSRRALPVAPEPRAHLQEPPTEGQAIASRATGYDVRQLVIMPADLRKVDREARKRGLDLDTMLPRWKAWCIEEGVRVANPAAHFTAFLKNHDGSRD